MDKAEELFQKRLLDLADSAQQKGIVTFTSFLNLNELNIFHSLMQKFPHISWKTFGGYDFAERQIAAFIPDALYYDWEFPIVSLKIMPLQKKFSDKLTHRDYLGAVLNLGIDRGKIGDILVEESGAYLFCHEKMADFFMQELCRIRHTAVSCQISDQTSYEASSHRKPITGTVASVRLDSLLALAFQASRSSLVSLIEGGSVFVNGRLVTSNGHPLKEGDIVSVRKMGRFLYKGVLSQTKKGRFSVEIEKYI